jgi:hypothetical protein
MLQVRHRAGSSETFREGEPLCEPSADTGSDGASPSPNASIATHIDMPEADEAGKTRLGGW